MRRSGSADARIPIAHKTQEKVGKHVKGKKRPKIDVWEDLDHGDFEAKLPAVGADLTVDHSETSDAGRV